MMTPLIMSGFFEKLYENSLKYVFFSAFESQDNIQIGYI